MIKVVLNNFTFFQKARRYAKVSLFFILISFVRADFVPSQLQSIITRSGMPQKHISILIKETKSDKVLVSLNASKKRNPASVIKLTTTYAAIAELGFDHRWTTDIGYRGSFSDGTLKGDLIIKAGGDPAMDEEDVERIAENIKKSGIKRIEGNIVIDRSIFDTSGGSSARFDENPYTPYNALPDAIMFRQNLSTITIVPQGSKIVTAKSFDDRSYKIKNNLRAVNTACRYRYAWPRVKIDQGSYPALITLSGEYSLRCPQRELDYIVTRSYYAFYFALVEALLDKGVSINGKLKLTSAKSYNTLLTHSSKSLKEIVSETNKKSNNLFARQIFLTLGYARYGEHADLGSSREALYHILQEKGVSGISRIKVDNGCGLSRSGRADALFFSSLLDVAYEDYGRKWLECLSIAGEDGTIKKRFDRLLSGKAWMKTGSLRNVKNIAGYVASKNGELYTVVILCEGAYAKSRGKKLQDDIVSWLRAGEFDAAHTIITAKKEESVRLQDDLYYIQVASTQNEPDYAFLHKIIEAGYSYKVYNHEGMHKVIVGPFDKKRADQELFLIKKKINFDAFIVKIIF